MSYQALSLQASEPHPTPSYSTEIHKLTCWSPGGMAAWGYHAFHGETSSRGGLVAGRGDCMQVLPPHYLRRRWAGGGNICIGTRLQGKMSRGSGCSTGGLRFVFGECSLISPNT